MTGALVIALVAGLAALAWRAAYRDVAPVGVVLITLDTTRADRLSPYGLMDVEMPHLERLAREGVLFHQATSVAPLTLPAHTSLFTGLIPPHHAVRDNADQALAPGHTTLAEVLRDRGFRTGAFVGSVVLSPDRGLAQGFDRYGGVVPKERGTADSRHRRADAVVTEAAAWLEGVGDSRFFLWTHLYDPHRPYDPPEPYKSRHFDPYIGEIVFADAQIGRLLETLERRRLLDRTIVIVTADHGESLGDHGERDHGIFVYESVVRVPLIVRAPKVRPGTVDDVVRLIDVMPTVLDLLEIEAPAMDGVSLTMALGGKRLPNLEAYAESLYPQRFGWSPVRSLRDGRFKMIDAPRPELYDLERDPFEERNVYQERRAAAEGFRRRMDVLAGGSLKEQKASPASPDLQERLAALGYVGTPAAQPSSDREGLPDPKDCIGLLPATPGESAVPGARVSFWSTGPPSPCRPGSLAAPSR